MSRIVEARAFCNNEVAYLAWKSDGKLEGCLGFMITRIHLDTGERRILPAWVAFETQSNPNWEPQDTSVWPVQKFSWRDLTLRRSRDSLNVRKGALHVRYEIVPVGLAAPGRKAVPAPPAAQKAKYKGKRVPLFICGKAALTNEIKVTTDFGAASASFTNGILSTQNLRKQLETKPGKAPTKKQLEARITSVGDAVREYLAGDVLDALRGMFQRADADDGKLFMALYELSDPELLQLLLDNQKRLHLILSTAGSPAKGSKTWDGVNADARAKLASKLKTRLQHRMFNNSAHIGHNKFAVLVIADKPRAVWTGSTNWTSTGLCAQSNNTISIDSAPIARRYHEYWQRLHDDKQPVPAPIGAPNKADQGPALRAANMQPIAADLDAHDTHVRIWFSPNTEETRSASTRTVPPDLADVFSLMRKAKDAIFFLVFNPGRTNPASTGEDVNTVVSAGIDFGRLDPNLLVLGAISDPTAVPGFQPRPKDEDPAAPKPPQLAIFSPPGTRNVLMIRAAAIKDLVGDFDKELLTAGHAIIHDKIVVIDPMSEEDCVVITGSHNLGFKASYANDENLLIIRGNRKLALAYAVHVLDVYDHYKFRAVLEQQAREAFLAGKPRPKRPTNKGFLDTTADWQDPYFEGRKGQEHQYFLR